MHTQYKYAKFSKNDASQKEIVKLSVTESFKSLGFIAYNQN